MKEKLKTLLTIHLTITLGTMVAYYFLGQFGTLANLTFPPSTLAALPYLAIPVVAIVLSTFLFKHFIGEINPKLTIEQQFGSYQTASIIRWAILEGAALLLIVLQPTYWVFGVVLIGYLVVLRPTESRLEEELGRR